MRKSTIRKMTIWGAITALLLLAVASVSPLHADPFVVDTSGIAFREGSHTNPYAVFLNPSVPDDAVGICCGPTDTVTYQVDILEVDFPPTPPNTYSFFFDVFNGSILVDQVQLYLTLSPAGPGPYYLVTDMSGWGDWTTDPLVSEPTLTPGTHGPLAISLYSTPTDFVDDGGGHTVDNLFDPTGATPEPSSWLLLATGLLAMALVMRKRIA
jgi:hypothetical protein